MSPTDTPPAPTLSRRARKRRNATIRAAEDQNLTVDAYAVLCIIAINSGPSTTTEILPSELLALEANMLLHAAKITGSGQSRDRGAKQAIAESFRSMFDQVWGAR